MANKTASSWGEVLGKTTHKKTVKKKPATKKEREEAKKVGTMAVSKGAVARGNTTHKSLKDTAKDVGEKYSSYAEKFRKKQDEDIKNAPKKIADAKDKVKKTASDTKKAVSTLGENIANPESVVKEKRDKIKADRKHKSEVRANTIKAVQDAKKRADESKVQGYDSVREAQQKSIFANGKGETNMIKDAKKGYDKHWGNGAYDDGKSWTGSTKVDEKTLDKAKNTDVQGVYHNPKKPEKIDTNLAKANEDAKRQFDIDVRRRYDNAFSSEKELKKFLAGAVDKNGNPLYSDADIRNIYAYYSQNPKELEKFKREMIEEDKKSAYSEIDKAIPLQVEKQFLNKDELAQVTENLRYNPQLRSTALVNANPKLAEKLGDIEAQQYVTKGGRIGQGILEGSSAVPIHTVNGASNTGATYNDTANAMIQAGQNTWSYRGGYMAGMLGAGAVTGATGLESSLVKAGVLKLGASSTAHNIVKKRLAGLIVNSPIDIIDSVKMSYNDDGSIDPNKLFDNLAINLGASAMFGLSAEGLGAVIKTTQFENLTKAINKMNNGMELTPKERKLLEKLNGKEATGYVGYDAKVKEAGEVRTKYDAEQVSRKADDIKNAENVTGEVDVVAGQPKKSPRLEDDNAQQLAQDMHKLPNENITQPYVESPKRTLDEKAEKSSSPDTSSKPKNTEEDISDDALDRMISDSSKNSDSVPSKAPDGVDTLEAKYLANDKASRDLMLKHKELTSNVKKSPNVYGKALKETEKKLYDEYGITALGDGNYADVYGEIIDLTPSVKMLKEDPDFANLHEQYFQARLNLDSKNDKIFKSATETLRLARKKLKEKYGVTDTPDGVLVNSDGEIIELNNESVQRLIKADGEEKVYEPEPKKNVEVKQNVPAKDYNTGVFTEKKIKKAEDVSSKQSKKPAEMNGKKPKVVPPRMKTAPTKAKNTIEVAQKSSRKELDEFDKSVAGGDYTGFATPEQVKQFKKDMKNAKSLSPNRPIEHLTLGNISETAKYIKRKIFNDLQGFEDTAKNIPDGSLRESTLAVVNDVRKAFSKARHSIIGTHRYDFNGNKPSGESLNSIYVKAGIDSDLRKRGHFELYAVLQQHIDEMNQGGKILGSMGRNEAEKLIADLEIVYGNEIKQYHKDVVGYGRYLLKYRLDAGLISKEDYNYFLDMHPNYVPVMRVGDIDRFNINDNVTSTLGISNQIHARVGSDMNIIPLYDSLSSQTMAVVQSAHTNRMIDHISKVWNIDGSPVVKEALGDDPSKWEYALNSVPQTSRRGGGYNISFYRNGESYNLKVTKEMYYGLQDFANNNNSEVFEFFEKNGVFEHNPLPKINNAYKSLITDYNIVFGIRNFSRDMGTALFTTKNLRGYLKSVPEAIKQITTNGELYKLYMANGGLYSNFVNGKSVDINVHGLEKAWKNTLDGSLGRIAELNNFIETIPRMTEFVSALDEFTKGEALVTTKKLSKDQIAKAMYRANDVTVNFSRSGKWGRMASTNFVPFLNASLQGMDKLVRVFSETGYGKTGAGKVFNHEMAGVVAKASAFGIAPAVINEFLNAGNEDYQWLTDRDKDNYFLFPLGDGEFIKVPKSRETSVLAFPFIYPMRYAMYGKANGDKPITEWKNCFNDTWDLVGPVNPLKDNIFSGVINVAHNKTYFGGDINYEDDLKLIADGKNYLAYDESTSEVAKWLGKKLNRSPKSIDKLMDNYLGFIYDMGIKPNSAKYHSDASTTPEKIRNWAVTVGKTNFIVDALFSTKAADTYWTKLDEVDGEDKFRMNANYTGDITSYSDAIHFMLNRYDLTVADKTARARELRRLRFEVYTDGVHGRNNNGNAWANICKLLATDKDKYGVRTFFTNADFMGVDEEHKGSSWGRAFTNLAMSDEYKNATNNEKFKMEKEFLDQYNSVHKLCRKIGTSDFFADYMVLAVDSVLNGRSGAVNDAILKEANAYDYVAKAEKYNGFGRTLDDFIKTQRRELKVAWKLGVEYASQMSSGQRGLSLATSKSDFIDTEYMISGASSKVAPARCLGGKYKWSNEKYAKFLSDNNIDNNTDPKKVESAIRKLGLGEEESSALFRLTVNDFKVKNPWGEVNGYGIAGDKGISNWGGYGHRRGHRKHWSHGWGSYNKSGVTNSYDKWLRQHTTSKKKKSNLNEAFRKKQLKNLKNTTGTIK